MNCSYYQQLINIEQDNIESSRRRSKIVLRCGIAVILVAVATLAVAFGITFIKPEDSGALSPITNALSPLLALFGCVVASSSALSNKDVPSCRARIVNYETLRQRCLEINDWPDDKKMEELEKTKKFLIG
jgi:hypothetical protein